MKIAPRRVKISSRRRSVADSARAEVLKLLGDFPQAAFATPAEVPAFIEQHEHFGVGIG